MADSPKYQLNKADGAKILKGLLIAMGGAGLVFLIDLIPNVNFSGWEYLVIPIASTLLNAVRKWLEGKK